MSAQKMADDTYKVQQHIESAQSEIDQVESTSPDVKDVETKTNEAKDAGKSIVIFFIMGLFAIGCIGYLVVNKKKWKVIKMGIFDWFKVRKLNKNLESGSTYVRGQAAKELGNIGDKSAIEPLTRALNNDAGLVSEYAKKALKKIR